MGKCRGRERSGREGLPPVLGAPSPAPASAPSGAVTVWSVGVPSRVTQRPWSVSMQSRDTVSAAAGSCSGPQVRVQRPLLAIGPASGRRDPEAGEHLRRGRSTRCRSGGTTAPRPPPRPLRPPRARAGAAPSTGHPPSARPSPPYSRRAGPGSRTPRRDRRRCRPATPASRSTVAARTPCTRGRRTPGSRRGERVREGGSWNASSAVSRTREGLRRHGSREFADRIRVPRGRRAPPARRRDRLGRDPAEADVVIRDTSQSVRQWHSFKGCGRCRATAVGALWPGKAGGSNGTVENARAACRQRTRGGAILRAGPGRDH